MDLERDTIVETAIERRNMLSLLGTLQLFRGLDAPIACGDRLRDRMVLAAGRRELFDAGDPPDALYFVISGCLGAFARTPDGHTRLVGRVAAGETVGEMAIISGKPRSATVIALRDTEIGRFSKQAFDALLLDHPQGDATGSRSSPCSGSRARSASSAASAPCPKTFTVIPQDIEVDVRAFADAAGQGARPLRAHRAGVERARRNAYQSLVSQRRIRQRVRRLCRRSGNRRPWSKLCMRQADSLLLLARAGAAPAPWRTARDRRVAPDAAAGRDRAPARQRLLAWLRAQSLARAPAGTCAPPRAPRRRRRSPGPPAHRPRRRPRARRRRRARIRTYRRREALREAGIPDRCGWRHQHGRDPRRRRCLEWSHEELVDRFRRSFVDTNPLNDYTLPLLSLVSGRKVTRLLRQEFGEIEIEDLRCRSICVSSNLYHRAHRRPPQRRLVALAARVRGDSRRAAAGLPQRRGARRWRRDEQSARSMSCATWGADR